MTKKASIRKSKDGKAWVLSVPARKNIPSQMILFRNWEGAIRRLRLFLSPDWYRE